MLTLSEEAEQTRINEAHRFGLHLAYLTQDDVERLASQPRPNLSAIRAALDDLAVRSSREIRCKNALEFARGGLTDGCDRSMQQLAGAGDNDCFGWGVAANPWMLLFPAAEVHALALALSDLLTPAEQAAAHFAVPTID
jgi:hypothetical protein